MGYAYSIYYWGAFRMDDETLQKAEDYANKAVSLDPQVAQGHFVLGLVAQIRGRMQTAFDHLQKALSLSPDDPDAIYWLVFTAMLVGKMEVTQPTVARLLEIDPLSANTYMASVLQHLFEGEFEAALEPARTTFRLDPDGNISRWTYFMACAYNQRLEEFDPVLEQWQREAPEHAWFQVMAAFAAANRGEEFPISDSTLDVAWKDASAAGSCMIQIFSMLGKIEESLKWLERSFELGFINYPMLSRIDPYLENLRRDPRSKKLFERIKHEWEHFEA
jgi:tetratricopeptide (TPR) repeat protein